MAGALSGPGVRVVLVGTGQHAPGSVLPDVDAVAGTVADLGEVLRQRCGLDAAGLCAVVNPSGPHVVDQAVRRVAAEATRLLMVYYVGHGLQDPGGELYLATAATEDLARSDAAAAHYQALPYRTVRDAVSDSRAGSVIVVLDCCWAARASAAVVTGSDDVFAMAAVRDSYLLTAASRDEAALAVPGARHTAFTGALLELLEHGDPTGPPELTLEAAYRYLARVLPAAGRPEPRRYAAGRAGDLPLTDNRAYQLPPRRPRHHPDGDVPAAAVDAGAGLCPYQGLEAFDGRSSRFFHGRDLLIADVLRQIADRRGDPRPLIVVGASGAGKTSLLRAGVLPALSTGDEIVPGCWRWPQLVLRPGGDPLGSLAAALAGPAGEPADRVRATLAADPASLRRYLHAALAATADPDRPDGNGSAARAPRRVLLVVDQFEELFTADVADSDRQAFVRALVAGTRGSDSEPDAGGGGRLAGPAVVVIGLRADYYGRCTDYRALAPALSGGQVVVGPMSRDELVQAITQPAAQAGLDLEDGLVDVLLRDLRLPTSAGELSRSAGTLPLLSYALLATWQHREGRLLTLAGYAATGGVEQAVARAADRVYARLDPPSRDIARRLLLALVSLGTEGGDDARRRRTRAELVDHADDPARAAAVLEAFAAEQVRLLTLDDTTVEITHEALLHAWPTLRSWVDTDRAGLLVTQRLIDDAHTWAAHDHDPDLIYRGGRLTLARDRPPIALPAVARDFLHASIQAEHQRTRRTRLVVAGIAALLVLALAAGSIAAVQWRHAVAQSRVAAMEATRATGQANLATGRGLVAVADRLAPTDPRTALRLNLAAAAISRQAGAADRLTDILADSHLRATLTGHAGAVNDIAVSANGRIALTGSTDHTARVWDLTDPAHPTGRATLTGDTEAVDNVALSADGHTALTSSWKTTAIVWDLTDPAHPARRATLTGHTDAVNDVALSPDGRIALTCSVDATAIVWDLTDPAHPLRRATITDTAGPVVAVALSADRRTALTGSGLDYTTTVWDLADPAHPARRATLAGHTTFLAAVALSPDGRTALTGSDDRTAIVWDLTDPAHPARRATLTGHTDEVSAVALSPDGRTALTGSQDRTAIVWDLTDPAHPVHRATLTGHADAVTAAALSPDGRTALTGSSDKTAILWDLRPTHIATFATETDSLNGVVTVALSSDRRTALTGSSDRATIWDLTDPMHPTRRATLIGQTDVVDVESVALSASGRIALTGSTDGVTVWDLTDPAHPTRRATLTGQTDDALASLALSANGGTALTGSADGVTVWDLTDPAHPTRRATLTGHTDSVTDFALSADGRTALTRSEDRTAIVWDLTHPAHPTRRATLTGHTDPVSDIALSADGRTALTRSEDRTAIVWDLTHPAHPTRRATLTGHTGAVTDFALSADGRTALTGSQDRTAIVWDLTDPAHPIGRATLTGHTSDVWAVALSNDGRTALTIDGAARVWDLRTLTDLHARATDQACIAAAGGLSRAEWERYIPAYSYRITC